MLELKFGFLIVQLTYCMTSGKSYANSENQKIVLIELSSFWLNFVIHMCIGLLRFLEQRS